jgi:histidinol-phosphatase (PHP family)
MLLTNYHSHSHFCDGTEPPETYVLEAIRRGFASYGFSSHIPLRDFDTAWNMKRERLEEYVALIASLKEKYSGQLELYCAFETDFRLSVHLRDELMAKYPAVDYTVGSVHYVGFFDDGRPWEVDGSRALFEKGLAEIYGGDVRAVLREYFNQTCEMILHEKPDILGHADKIKMHGFFSAEDTYFRSRMHEVLELLRDTGTIMEINTRGFYKGYTHDFYPGISFIKEASRMGVRLQVNSDAHTPSELSAGYDQAYALLREIGHLGVWIRQGKEWKETGIS